MNLGKILIPTGFEKLKLAWLNICEHSYTRDNYAYAPLYCRHCLTRKRASLATQGTFASN